MRRILDLMRSDQLRWAWSQISNTVSHNEDPFPLVEQYHILQTRGAAATQRTLMPPAGTQRETQTARAAKDIGTGDYFDRPVDIGYSPETGFYPTPFRAMFSVLALVSRRRRLNRFKRCIIQMSLEYHDI